MNIVFAGFGGQGVLTSGLIIANMAQNMGKEVLWMPSYGGQMRGGKSYSLVKFDDKPICHPDIEELDILCAMNGPALAEFSGFVKSDGLILVNSDMISEDISINSKCHNIFRAPFASLAETAGNPRGLNLSALGLLSKLTNIAGHDYFLNNMLDYFAKKGKARFNEINILAFEKGYNYETD